MMDPRSLFSAKAARYARYRWDYTPAALQAIFETARLSAQSRVADLGAGTGILTRRFAGRVGYVYALEPNPEMRTLAGQALAGLPACAVIAASAEAVPLRSASIDLITVAQAIHWFEPAAARGEFLRLLKPGGWLAILNNTGTDKALGQALRDLHTPEHGVDTAILSGPAPQPLGYFFGSDDFQTLGFPFTQRQDQETFAGSLASASYAPDEDHPLYPAFVHTAHEIFARFSQDGWLDLPGLTELHIGQVT
ncbi:MAG: class I SAM-dependent methyltransferase [Chloroflexota bacterium]